MRDNNCKISMKYGITKNQKGMVSIMVTMVMMVVISLIVLGFAEISGTEQRNSTDDLLSTQAYYAAESGVNDAVAAIQAKQNLGQVIPDKNTCQTDLTDYPKLTQPNINNQDNVENTCLLIDAHVLTLSYTANYKPTIIPIISTASFGTVTLQWGPANGASQPRANPCSVTPGKFPIATASGWNCDYPVLRVDMADTGDSNSKLERSNWVANTSTMFFLPTLNSANTGNVNWGAQGSVISTNCTSGMCTATINNLAPNNSENYYLMVTTIYGEGSSLKITADQPFYNVQALIDSTGRAQDTLRRIVVAIDLTGANKHPVASGALITENTICKQFSVTTNSFAIQPPNGQATYPGSSDPATSNVSNILCNQTT
jgi:Tfp pilus assembly protein PilX